MGSRKPEWLRGKDQEVAESRQGPTMMIAVLPLANRRRLIERGPGNRISTYAAR